jgi:hypothetical protein
MSPDLVLYRHGRWVTLAAVRQIRAQGQEGVVNKSRAGAHTTGTSMGHKPVPTRVTSVGGVLESAGFRNVITCQN